MSAVTIEVEVVQYIQTLQKLRVIYNNSYIDVPAFQFQFRTEYRPKKIVCKVGRKADKVILVQDYHYVLDNLYEEDVKYEFKIIALKKDKINKSYLELCDQYNLYHRLYCDNTTLKNYIGKLISCKVKSISDYLKLEYVDCKKNILNKAVIKAQNPIYFEKLHNKRLRQYNSINDRSMRGVWASVIDKYPDSAHFIYELLQNADDAEASEVTIFIDKDVLYFKHNGKIQFTITDDDDETITPGHINAIVGIGNSSKDDGNKIGKFGVGFKAVFQYTNSPIIYCDDYKFKINNYIVPELINYDSEYRKAGETLFEIPFKNPETNYKEIINKLNNLNHPILFLNNIKSVIWDDLTDFESNRTHHCFSKKHTESFVSDTVKCTKIIEKNNDKTYKLWLFSTKVGTKEYSELPISVGYFLKDNIEGKEEIDTKIRPKVYCFFPTSESFNSCFICHAPFLLVDNRQQVKRDKQINKFLRDSLCTLATNALVILRDIGIRYVNFLITDNIFDIIPIHHNRQSISSYYECRNDDIISLYFLFSPFSNMLKENNILLSRSGKYLLPEETFLAQHNSLIKLLLPEQLRELKGMNNNISDFFSNNPGKNSELYTYLTEELKVNSLSFEDLAKNISSSFMNNQPFDWVIKFYRTIQDDARSLWNTSSISGISFCHSPIIQTSNNEWVAPYIEDSLNVFFESDNETYGCHIINNRYLSNDTSKQFLIELGVKEPNIYDYIKNSVLIKYHAKNFSLTHEEQLSDLDIILKYYKNVPVDKKYEYTNYLREFYYLHGTDSCGKGWLCKGCNLYYPTPSLKKYFKGHEGHYFFNSVFYESIIKKYDKDLIDLFLEDMRIKYSPRIMCKKITSRRELTDWQINELNANDFNIHQNESGEETYIDGFENALNNLTEKLSIQIWDWMCDYIKLSKDNFILEYYFFYRKSIKRICDSHSLHLLKESPWIYVSKNKKISPKELSLEQFIELKKYKTDYTLCEFLGIVPKHKSLEQLGANAEQIELFNDGLKLKKLLKQFGIKNIEEMEKRLQQQAKSEDNQKRKLKRKEFIDTPRGMNEYSAEETFQTDARHPLKNNNRTTNSETINDEKSDRINKIIQKQKEELDKEEQRDILRHKIDEYPKYSIEWFETLIKLECENEGDNIDTFGKKSCTIVFTKVIKDPDSDRIFILKYPSSPIPLEIEEIVGLEVNFTFNNIEELNIGFEVASVRDFTLRLKAKISEYEKLSQIDWNRCTKAEIKINNSISLINRLATAFSNLYIPKGTNLKEYIPQNISFIYGPPGTGKTTYLSNRIIQLMSQSQTCRILVMAPTNKACDVLTEKISNTSNTLEWLGRFLVTGSSSIEEKGIVIDKTSELYKNSHCCIISTIARLSYDGFVNNFEENLLKDINWDYIIIDEASMIPLYQIMYAIYNFKDCEIIIAGDPKQITPIVKEEAWKRENIYSMINLTSFNNPETEPVQFNIINLTTQYRSIPQIGRLFSEYSYDNLLKHNRTEKDIKQISIKGFDFMRPINFITFKVDKYDNICSPRKLLSSNIHVYSALLVIEIIMYITKNYKNKGHISIGIICPYAAQAQIIDKIIEQQSNIPEKIKISIGTIHCFQGDECDIVFVLFNPPKGLKYAADSVLVNDPTIVNVAISRAKDYLFLLFPEKDMDGFQYLREIINVGKIATKEKKDYSLNTSDQIERIIFGETGFIERNTFVTTHQLTNVYSKPDSLYEVRLDENSIDIQIK